MDRLGYFLFSVRRDPRFCEIEEVDEKVEKGWKLANGERMGEFFPSTVELQLAMDGGDWVTDFINNINQVVILSRKARLIFEVEGVGEEQVEYLPFVLKDRRGHVIDDEQFYVANALVKVDCFDWQRSVYKTFSHAPREIIYPSLRRMCLREEAIPEDAKFFRLGEQTDRYIIRSDLVERLKAEGCTGLSLRAMGEDLF
ncbi:hypothetical protein HPC49_53185 [Pyxidicoccus fallax]|uniref:Immunity MXAN-0049 protein domain-containing protein n=1 Tax=Pyxidicoccus fallax TaxID=394095 RepID=A0A848M113_9BACT|nr:DUF1629 domain-containing protein [Pyxidicoccus fallax]NMO23559.1 hypothetical protein [Pyxidicoccus fallax]NPC86926.1 hypothetical protein [Pyxidicoccus fallax]